MPPVRLIVRLEESESPGTNLLIPGKTGKETFFAISKSFIDKVAPDAIAYEFILPDLDGADICFGPDGLFQAIAPFLNEYDLSESIKTAISSNFPLVTFDSIGRAVLTAIIFPKPGVALINVILR